MEEVMKERGMTFDEAGREVKLLELGKIVLVHQGFLQVFCSYALSLPQGLGSYIMA